MPNNHVLELRDLVTAWVGQLNGYNGSHDDPSSNLDIDFSKLRFKHSEAIFDDAPLPAAVTAQAGVQQRFENTSDQTVEWTPDVRRKYTAKSKLEVTQGVVIDGLPQKIQVGGPSDVIPDPFSTGVTFDKTETVTMEQEWSEAKRIPIPPHTEAVVKFYVEEKDQLRDFTINSSVRGKIRVTVLDTDDDLVASHTGDIVEIMRNRYGNIKTEPTWARIQGRSIVYETRGRCSFRYAVDARTSLEMAKLKSSPARRW